MKKTVQISEPDARVDAPDPTPSNLASIALDYKHAVARRSEVLVILEKVRRQCTTAESELADVDIEVGQLKQALAKAALE